jgi:hypothetical protein
MFRKLQQKDASVFLTTLWKNEPFKAKWTIIAKAYSRIRDAVGTHRASLIGYLTLVCPKIGIIAMEDYLGKMNWTFEAAADGTQVLKQTTAPELSCFETNILYTNMTPTDIVHFCARVAYIPQHIAIRIAGADVSDAVGALPFNQMAEQSLLASHPILPQKESSRMVSAEVVRSSPTTPQSAGNRFGAFPARDGDSQWTGSMGDLYNPIEGNSQWTGSMGDLYHPADSQWTGSMRDLYHPAKGSINLNML